VPQIGERGAEEHVKVMKVRNSAAAFTLVEIMIVVAVIGVLAAIGTPNFVRARTTSQKNVCINSLRQIDGAMNQWALEFKKDPTASVTEADVMPYLKTATICPSGGTTFADSLHYHDGRYSPDVPESTGRARPALIGNGRLTTFG
jgi:prepilin-type N-terminal cleavage/methylation domain-containing protein